MDNPATYIDELMLILISYFTGCLCVGYYLVVYFTGKDIRTCGSGNLGARNVGRMLGRAGFVFTLIGDAGKAYLIVAIVSYLNYPPYFQVLIILSTIMGHVWPVQLKFKGGKGYATMIGGLLAYDVKFFLVILGLAGFLLVIFRRVNLIGLIAIALVPLSAVVYKETDIVVFEFFMMALLVSYAHKENMYSEFEKIKNSKNKK